MTIAFFSNFINHHQVHVADELYALYGDDYTFVEILPMPDTFKRAGYPDYASRPYVLQAWADDNKFKKAEELAKTVSVALFDGFESLVFEKIRYKENTASLSFEVSERWCKKGWVNYLSPRFIDWYWSYIRRFRKCNIKVLCCSAFMPNDLYRVQAFRDKCYKWAYFTKSDAFDIDEVLASRPSEKISIMWCARFISWKHPEMVVEAAKILRAKGYNFGIDMYGGGELLDEIKKSIAENHLEAIVQVKGNAPNETLLQEMRKHHIFLFTSDKNEGWGAVANEALSNGCAVVGDECIGAVPFLVEHGKNGRIYKTKNVGSLVVELSFYINHRKVLESNGREAYRTMREVWSPKNAVKQLLKLINSLHDGNENPIESGPCSKAYPIIQ